MFAGKTLVSAISLSLEVSRGSAASSSFSYHDEKDNSAADRKHSNDFVIYRYTQFLGYFILHSLRSRRP